MAFLLALALAAGTAAARDVTGAFQTVYWVDSGAKTTVAAPQPGTSIFALKQSKGVWTRYPGTLKDDGSFVVPGVPKGVYFLGIDDGSGSGPSLTELTTSTPDASTIVARRPNVAYAGKFTPVALSISGLDPWQPGDLFTGDLFQIDGSQSGADLRPFRNNGKQPNPAPGATSYKGTIDWRFRSTSALPDAAQGDVTWFHSNPHSIIGKGPAAMTLRQATRYSKRDDVTVTEGGPNTIAVELQAAPQSGSLRADVRYSQFQQLALQANPKAVLGEFDFDVFGYPHTADFPDRPAQAPAPVLIFFGLRFNGNVPGDTDYGTLRYGEFLDSHWVKTRQVIAAYTVSFTAPGASAPADWAAAWGQGGLPETADLASQAIAPRIAPLVPFIEGKDGFAAQSQVSLTPTISWTQQGQAGGDGDDEENDNDARNCGRGGGDDDKEARRHHEGDGREERGHARGEERREGCGASVSVTVVQLGVDDAGGTSFTPVLAATVYGRSFSVPPGFLTAGSTYFVDLGSNHGSWIGRDQPLFRGGPSEGVDTVTEAFTTAAPATSL